MQCGVMRALIPIIAPWKVAGNRHASVYGIAALEIFAKVIADSADILNR